MNNVEKFSEFRRKHARKTDIETSKAAAGSAEKPSTVQKQKIIAALKISGPRTSEELAEITGLSHAQTWRRVSDLKNDKLVVDTDERRKNESGRLAAVWRAK